MAYPRQFSDEEMMAALAECGGTYTAAARRLGVSVNSLSKRATRVGVKSAYDPRRPRRGNPKKRRFSDEQLLAALAEGGVYATAARTLHVSANSIAKRVARLILVAKDPAVRAALDAARKARVARSPAPHAAERQAERAAVEARKAARAARKATLVAHARRRRAEGATLAQIGAELGVSRERIRKILLETTILDRGAAPKETLMHADNICDHQTLTQKAAEIVAGWKGTDPMTSEDDVRRALVAAGTPADELDALLPYVVDACREEGLLGESPIAAQAAESAKALVEQGWEGDGAAYDLGAYPGDAGALRERLGRPLTREDRLGLERQIRAHLDAAAAAAPTVRSYIAISVSDDSSTDAAVYPLDTDEQVAEARAALREAGLDVADVWVGEPGSSDTYKNGRRLFAGA